MVGSLEGGCCLKKRMMEAPCRLVLHHPHSVSSSQTDSVLTLLPAPRAAAPEWPLSWGGVGRPVLPTLHSARRPRAFPPAPQRQNPLGFFLPLENLILLNRVLLPFLAFVAGVSEDLAQAASLSALFCLQSVSSLPRDSAHLFVPDLLPLVCSSLFILNSYSSACRKKFMVFHTDRPPPTFLNSSSCLFGCLHWSPGCFSGTSLSFPHLPFSVCHQVLFIFLLIVFKIYPPISVPAV